MKDLKRLLYAILKTIGVLISTTIIISVMIVIEFTVTLIINGAGSGVPGYPHVTVGIIFVVIISTIINHYYNKDQV